MLLGEFDIIVIGAGHAGIEAAHAAAVMGANTALFTLSLDAIANLPCNPSIGGTAKAHLVREIDALGGVMGIAADATYLQSRMLNLGKGPAVHSLRVQTDRRKYHSYMKAFLEKMPNLSVKQAEICKILVKDEAVYGICTNLNGTYHAKKIIIASGTYLGGKIFVGDASFYGGPDGQHAASELSENLKQLGLPLRRFKTGTPARVHRHSINFEKLEVQYGDEKMQAFSFMTKKKMRNRVTCHIAYTNKKTHDVILQNLHRSPLYGGDIEGIGPRYCPSIEDKVVRFAEKERHQLFIEPCGLNTNEMYLQGMSSSLPEDVQNAMYRTIIGLENVEIMRPAYAIEYDCINPTALYATMETKAVKGLYGAGQFCSTSGYEEAAAQGLVAGVNAALSLQNNKPFILKRSNSYIGTLIDDLITKGASDPYRMMTSRSEYRLFLRQDNADERLTQLGFDIGLASKKRYDEFCERSNKKESVINILKSTIIRPFSAEAVLTEIGEQPLQTGQSAADLLRRPKLNFSHILQMVHLQQQNEGENEKYTLINRAKGDDFLMYCIETEIKYEGYIKRQVAQIKAAQKSENTQIPTGINYNEIDSIRLEAREKLSLIRPENIAQASRIPGVSPADISCLLLYILKMK